MKLEDAKFTFRDSKRGDIRVHWVEGNEERPKVVVWIGNKDQTFDNANHQWKPCVTHCKELIRSAIDKPPENEFAKRRRAKEKMKPLAVFK